MDLRTPSPGDNPVPELVERLDEWIDNAEQHQIGGHQHPVGYILG